MRERSIGKQDADGFYSADIRPIDGWMLGQFRSRYRWSMGGCQPEAKW